jgi:hypothetical protein
VELSDHGAAAVSALGLVAQIACVRREIALRESCYPRWIKSGRMKEARANQELAAMKAVLGTLQTLYGVPTDIALSNTAPERSSHA